MPQLGETVAEGKITKWFKAAGDAVKPGDNLFEIETDKVSMEVPSTTAGVLSEIRVPAGDVAPVGEAAVVAASDDATGAAVVVSAPPPEPQLVSTTAQQHAAADRTYRYAFNTHPKLSHHWFSDCDFLHRLLLHRPLVQRLAVAPP